MHFSLMVWSSIYELRAPGSLDAYMLGLFYCFQRNIVFLSVGKDICPRSVAYIDLFVGLDWHVPEYSH